jgi:hypothetical protein
MANDLNIFVVHGFKSNCDLMKSTNGYLMNNTDLLSKINGSGFNWSAGPEDGNLNLIIDFFINRPELLRTLNRQWESAWRNIPFTANELSDYVCVILDESDNKHIVFVGHSLGAELIRETIPLVIRKRHAIIDLFIMAGVSNRIDYERTLQLDNVRMMFNIYSKSDMILKIAKSDFTTHSEINDPIGLSEIKNKKVINIEVHIDHDEYNNSHAIQEYFKIMLDNVLKSPKVG